MHALIDGDILPYEMGGLKDEWGDTLPFEMCWKAVQNKIASIVEATKADKYTIYLSSPALPTWRYEYATIKPYKGTRKSEKSRHWEAIRTALVTHYPFKLCCGIEADDGMSIYQYDDYYKTVDFMKNAGTAEGLKLEDSLATVICSRDKDLLMVPGFHYGWASGKQKEQPMWFQEEIAGLRCFYRQLCTGDSVDNILGLFRVGAKSSMVDKLKRLPDAVSMYDHVLTQYKDRFGSYGEQFLLENARLLWMQRTEEDRWLPPTTTVSQQQES